MLTSIELSVVIITRNEVSTISAGIKSVLECTRGIDAEVILVDSASTDGTVETASGYPVTIVRLDPSNSLSPSAGRFVGTKLARGRLLFFVDGDMTVQAPWLQIALPRFRDPGLGALAGRVLFVSPEDPSGPGIPDDHPVGVVPGIGGTGIYRHDVLQKAGSFNPYLHGEEERELGHRIAAHGYRVERLDVPMASHFSKHRTTDELAEKSKHFAGVGQILRHYGFGKISREILTSQLHVFLPSITLGVTVVVAAILFATDHHAAAISSLLLLLAAVGIIMMKKGAYRTLRFLGFNALTIGHGIQGYWHGLKDPEEYWKVVKYEVVRTEPGGH